MFFVIIMNQNLRSRCILLRLRRLVSIPQHRFDSDRSRFRPLLHSLTVFSLEHHVCKLVTAVFRDLVQQLTRCWHTLLCGRAFSVIANASAQRLHWPETSLARDFMFNSPSTILALKFAKLRFSSPSTMLQLSFQAFY